MIFGMRLIISDLRTPLFPFLWQPPSPLGRDSAEKAEVWVAILSSPAFSVFFLFCQVLIILRLTACKATFPLLPIFYATILIPPLIRWFFYEEKAYNAKSVLCCSPCKTHYYVAAPNVPILGFLC